MDEEARSARDFGRAGVLRAQSEWNPDTCAEVMMSAAVELREQLDAPDSERGLELVTNLARYAEGLLDEAVVKKMETGG